MSGEGECKRLKLTQESEEISGEEEDNARLLDEVNYVNMFLQSYGFEDVPVEIIDILSSLLKDWINTVSKTFTFKKKKYYYFHVLSMNISLNIVFTPILPIPLGNLLSFLSKP